MTRLASDARLALADSIAKRVRGVEGVAAVVLGGSAAMGTSDRLSDLDMGIYYRDTSRPALADLRALAQELDGERGGDAVTDFGDWGPWINGGAWLTVDGIRVDWLYRELGRVELTIAECERGVIRSDYQPGHPHAFHSHMYLGEVREAIVLVDATGILGALQRRVATYPDRLRLAIVERFLWESRFAIDVADKSAARGDVPHLVGSLYRSVACLVQVLFALNRASFLNEKRSVDRIELLATRPDGFPLRVGSAFALATSRSGAGDALRMIESLVTETEHLVAEEDEPVAEIELSSEAPE